MAGSNDEAGRINLGLNLVGRNLDRQVSSMADSVAGMAKKAFSAVGITMGTAVMVSFTKQCINLGSDLAEVQNVVDNSFKTMSESVNEFARNAITDFGLSETVAKKYMGTIGAMNNAFGFTEQQSLDMAEAVTGLAGDVASFYNLESDDAFTKLKGIWTGETEALKDLGVVMTQTALDEYALNNGFGKTTAKMTEQEKVMLRFRYVTDTLSTAAGDFIRTQDGWANQTRVLTLRFDSLKATLGQGFINLFTPVLKVVNQLIDRLQLLADGFVKLTEAVTGKKAEESVENIALNAGSATENISGMGDAAAESAKKATKALAGFDLLNNMSSTASDSDAGSTASGGTISAGINIDSESADYSASSVISDAVDKFLEPLKNISFDNLKQSFSDLKMELGEFGTGIWSGIQWGYENILIPLAAWTIEDAIPVFLDLCASAMNDLNLAVDVLKPGAAWFWDNVLKPFAKWSGNKLIKGLGYIKDGLDKLGSWIIKNKEELTSFVTDVLQELGTKLIDIGSWCADHTEVILTAAAAVGSFALAWKGIELAEFIINAGGVIGILKKMKDAIYAVTVAKAADKIETLQIVGLYVKDFVTGIAKGTAALIKNAVQWTVTTAAKAAGTAATIASTAATTAATAATWLFNAALAVLTSPITLVIAAIAALVAGIILLVKNWDTVKEVACAVWDGIKSTWNGVASWFESNVIQPLGRFFTSLWNGVCETAENAWTWILGLFEKGGKIFNGIKDGIVGAFKTIVNALIGGINKIINIPFEKINGLLNAIRDTNILGFKPFESMWESNPLPVPQIPMLAKGGIIDTPTLAMVGEAGREAVMPLENNTGWISSLADEISRHGGTGRGEYMAILLQILEILKEILEKDMGVSDDALFRSLRKSVAAYKKITGTLPW